MRKATGDVNGEARTWFGDDPIHPSIKSTLYLLFPCVTRETHNPHSLRSITLLKLTNRTSGGKAVENRHLLRERGRKMRRKKKGESSMWSW